ncbi:beta strand repeat-containing protein [Bradyrhizobium manausense]
MQYNSGGGLAGDSGLTYVNPNLTIGYGSLYIGTSQATSGTLYIGGMNGVSYPSSDTTRGASIAIGPSALANQPASAAYSNIAIGSQALSSASMTTAAVGNAALGFQALANVTSGNYNTGVGYQAGMGITTGASSVAIGDFAALTGTGGTITAVGGGAGSSNMGQNTVAVGFRAGKINMGANSVAVGYQSLYNLSMTSSAANETALGYQSGLSITTGANNTILGYNVASATLNTGSNNILIGTDNQVDTPAQGTNNFLNIGNLIYGTSIGTAASPGKVGIGATAPTALLDIPGAWSGGNTIGQLVLGSTNNAGCLTLRRGSDGSPQGELCYASPTDSGELRLTSNGGAGLLTFYAGGTEHMRLTTAGNVGIGTTAPLFPLSIGNGAANDGGIYAQGYSSVGTSGVALGTVGAGTRMIWYPKKAAFQVGGVDSVNPNDTSSAWRDDTNIGNYSVALGQGCKASGSNSFCVGQYATASGTQAFAMGGSFATASSTEATAMGHAANAAASNAFAIGYTPSAFGTQAISFSTGGSQASGKASMALGYQAHTGSSYGGSGGDYSMAVGLGSTAATMPYVSGTYSLGIFMGDQGGAAVTADKVMAILGGNVGIGTTNPQALLDVYSTSNGILPPRMTTAQRNAISSPATGLAIYNTDYDELETYNSVTYGWEAVGAGALDAAGSNGQVQWNNSGILGASSNLYWDNTNIRLGIGTSTINNALSFGGDAGRTIAVEAASSGAGNGLTIRAGNAQSGSTNQNGGNLTLIGGIGTGNGSSGGQIIFQTTTNGASGTTYESWSTRMSISGNNGGVQINSTFTPPTDIFTVGGNISLFSNPSSGGIGGLNFRGLNASGNQIVFASTAGGITSKVAGAENGYMNFAVYEAGTNTTTMQINDVGGVAIGNSYIAALGTSSAPSNGLIVQGNVGIGTTSPAALLEVNGAALIDTGAVIGTGASSPYLQLKGATAYKTIKDDAGTLDIWNGPQSQALMSIQEGGNVGIGTTAPSAALDVVGTILARDNTTGTNNQVYINAGNSTTAGSASVNRLRFGGSESPNAYFTIQGVGNIDALTINGTSGIYNVGIGTNVPLNKLDVSGGSVIGAGYIGTTTAPSNGLIVQGNVGIGATSPSYPLSVTSASATQAAFVSTGTNSAMIVVDDFGGGNQSSLKLRDAGSDIYQIGKQGDNSFFIWDQAHTRDSLRINTSGNLLLVPVGGNVGIGTTLPQATLDVHGSMFVESVNAGSATSIDWSQSTTQYTTASCGSFTFTNMQDGGTYQLFVEGTTSGTCSFSQSGMTFKMPSNHGATTAGTMTVYSFTRAGTNVFVAWIPAY